MNKKKDTYVEANLKSEYLHHYEENMKISNVLQETGPGQKLRSFNKATLEISSLHKGKKPLQVRIQINQLFKFFLTHVIYIFSSWAVFCKI